MKMKGIVTIMLSLVMVSMAVGVIATDTTPIEWNGNGSATLANIAPLLPSTSINDGAAWVTNVDVDTDYLFYVNVSDVNTIDDIKSVSIKILVSGHNGYDNPKYNYEFTYTEIIAQDLDIDGTWAQVLPTAGVYLNVASCVAPADHTSLTGSYIFSVTMEKTARAGTWSYLASVSDDSGLSASATPINFNVYKYLEMTYDNGGSQDFAWVGSPGTMDAADAFTVTATSNTPYYLSAAYENRFYNVGTGTTWAAEPSLEVKYATSSAVALTNATAPPFAQWASFPGLVIDQTTDHTLYLDYEAVLPALAYTGVTIYIQASV